MSDNTLIILIGSILGLFIWSWILWQIVKDATKSARIEKLLNVQVKLLIEIAKSNGVDEYRINEAIHELN